MMIDKNDPFLLGNRSTPLEPLINGLEMIAASLTHIMDGHSLRLCDILESCPNLVSLSAGAVDAGIPLSTCYPKMTHLAIYNVSDTTLDYDTTVDVVSLFPSLLSFEIMPMPESSILTILHKPCPYLQRLYFGESGYPSDRIDTPHPDRKGIIRARLYGFHDIYIQDLLIQFLHIHRHSLETFECDGDILQDYNARWEISNGRLLQQNGDPTQSDTLLIRLNSIRFSNLCSSHCGPFMEWIISSAPNLKAIRLTEPRLQPAITNAMTTKSSHLSKLEIDQPWGRDYGVLEYQCKGIVAFLDYHIAMRDQSTLKEITIRAGMTLSTELRWLRLIPKLKGLKKLEILSPHILKDCVPLMEAIGQGCPVLESNYWWLLFQD